ncbi:hypothetical protein [Mycobacterium scrofulaceum]|uniref:Uncharacterized protein n=1 Tax=Mycobacterium scrofulaceum TaxID=1783 RepID=A0A1X0KD78_MYCSC|nr:hypothetical protein [Mycobacterium scrofulaceum]ORB73125.1 hypothetical protein BST44_16290 [Mycobacterium scrofulaceum]
MRRWDDPAQNDYLADQLDKLLDMLGGCSSVAAAEVLRRDSTIKLTPAMQGVDFDELAEYAERVDIPRRVSSLETQLLAAR